MLSVCEAGLEASDHGLRCPVPRGPVRVQGRFANYTNHDHYNNPVTILAIS